jgi:hypothetical protein
VKNAVGVAEGNALQERGAQTSRRRAV